MQAGRKWRKEEWDKGNDGGRGKRLDAFKDGRSIISPVSKKID